MRFCAVAVDAATFAIDRPYTYALPGELDVQVGCRVLALPGPDGRVDLGRLLETLGREGIDTVLVEGGGTLHWSFLQAGLAHRVLAYLSPMLLGGRDAKTPVEGLGFAGPDGAARLQNCRVTRLGPDFLIEGEVVADVHRDC